MTADEIRKRFGALASLKGVDVTDDNDVAATIGSTIIEELAEATAQLAELNSNIQRMTHCYSEMRRYNDQMHPRPPLRPMKRRPGVPYGRSSK